MPLTLTNSQQALMKDNDQVTNLATWVLGVNNHIATKIRRELYHSGNALAVPTRRQVTEMAAYLQRQVPPHDLVRLINRFQQQ